MKHVEILAGRVGPRPAGSVGYARASRYVERAFHRAGYLTEREPFEVPGAGPTWNIVARWPDGKSTRVLVGAHVDTVEGSPGANDNASGTGTVLELARVLAGTPSGRRTSFVAFGAEEQQPGGGHHYGSEIHAGSLPTPERDGLRAMVSVDMIGKAVPIILGWLGTERDAIRDLLKAGRRRGVETDEQILGDVSDHVPFALAGVPSALLWTGFEPNHHEPTDVVEGVEPSALLHAGRLLVTFVRMVTKLER
jgi:Zn-dependent M28 family amino/carboxypeptidase